MITCARFHATRTIRRDGDEARPVRAGRCRAECAVVTPARPQVPRAVLEAFGLPGRGHALAGGEGRSVRHGAAVLKPADDPVEAAWAAGLLAAVEPRGFRLARPLRARDGRWVVDGWTASEHLDGRTGPAGRWDEVLAAGRAFHAALRDVPCPGFLAGRTHRWARADRAAWGEERIPVPGPARELRTRLTRLTRPVRAPSQLVHGDLSGNVLFAAGLAPGVIDFSPYWRPAGYADAIVLIDGVLRSGAGEGLLVRGGDGAGFAQPLVRALLFRLVALTERAREDGPSCLAELPLLTAAGSAVERVVASAGR